MREAVVLASVEPGLNCRLVHFQERNSGSEPKMGLLVGGPPVAHVGDADETRRTGIGDAKGGFLVVIAVDGAGDVIRPGSGLDRGEADAQGMRAIRESLHQVGDVAR